MIDLRKATYGDAKNLFDLTNDEVVRRNSFAQAKIKWLEHLNWLENVLADKNRYLFIVEDDGRFIGQVRFDLEGRTAEISISLCENARGKGSASGIIEKAINEFSKEQPAVLIRAFIKRENVISQKTFEKADFELLDCVVYKKKI